MADKKTAAGKPAAKKPATKRRARRKPAARKPAVEKRLARLEQILETRLALDLEDHTEQAAATPAPTPPPKKKLSLDDRVHRLEHIVASVLGVHLTPPDEPEFPKEPENVS